MRIVLVTMTYPPSVNGVAVAVSSLKAGLEARGHEVLVFAPRNASAGRVDEKNVFRYPSMIDPLHRDYPLPLPVSQRFFVDKLGGRKPDLIHVQHGFHIGRFALRMSRLFDVPLVFTYHTNVDTYTRMNLGFLPGFLRNALSDRLIHRSFLKLCAEADLVVFPAEHTRRKVQAGLPRIKAVVVPSGVSIDRVGSVSRRHKSPAARSTLLHVGRLVVEKDIAMLIRALALLPKQYTLALVGDGPERRRLERLVKSLDLSRRVKFVGKVPHARVAQYYRGAGMLVVASETETQGLVFLEAMAHGLPIVAADSLAAREWIGRHHGLIVKRDAAAVASGVLKLATADLARIAAAQMRTARQYTTAMMIKRIEKAYKEAIAARAAR